jgi:hypothetical protein
MSTPAIITATATKPEATRGPRYGGGFLMLRGRTPFVDAGIRLVLTSGKPLNTHLYVPQDRVPFKIWPPSGTKVS